jgi:diguanylate cyclase (GGDEF)-like protein
MMDAGRSWLLPDGSDRERMVDMDRRLQPIRRTALAVLAVALLIAGPWVGWWTLVPLAIAGVLFSVADGRIERVDRPEYAIFAAWAASQVIIAISVTLSGPSVPAMAWFAIPVVTLSARFSRRGIVLGVGLSLALLFAVAFGFESGEVRSDPTIVVMPAALVLAVAILSTALMQSDVKHRTDAVVDPLTGLLNRNALDNRLAELGQQSALTGEVVGAIVADVDDFKSVNDTLGHATGDLVLRELGGRLREGSRAFELVYRLGGDEFLVLLPGADERQAALLAERLRRSVGGAVGEVRLSFGVAASERGEPLDFEAIFDAADRALYAAKADGGNRVVRASAVPALEPSAGGPSGEPLPQPA